MTRKAVLKSKKEVLDWINVANLWAKSLISPKEALKQFNLLTPEQRIQIKEAFKQCDEIRKRKLPKREMAEEWEISVMVDAHIIATEFNINPLPVVMCAKPICKANEQVIYK